MYFESETYQCSGIDQLGYICTLNHHIDQFVFSKAIAAYHVNNSKSWLNVWIIVFTPKMDSFSCNFI